jgi:pimeloyl-ACP methyl ester carboxylesterase
VTPPLPVEFFADGHRLDGDLYLPDAGAAPTPVLIALSGYLGLKGIHPARFARALTPRGWACLCFDYRGFGRSDGERGRIIPQEQAEDVRAAVSFLATVPAVDAGRLGLLGWALGGAVAIAAAADDDRVRAVATINAIAAGERTTRALHDADSWRALNDAIAADRSRRASGAPSRLIPPFDLLPLPPVTRAYVESDLLPAPGYGSQVSLEAAEWHLRFRPEEVVARISPRPLLLIHGADNDLYDARESERLYAAAGEPREQVLLPGLGHTEWMHDDDLAFIAVAERLSAFFANALGATALAR